MKLPKSNELGFFEMRLESIGGMGANSAGKMIADIGVLTQGYNGAAFSSYGSEKKGSPVKAFVRFSDPKIQVRVNSKVDEPHVLAVFHMNLLKNPTTLMGVKEDAIVLFNTDLSPEEARNFARLHGGKVVCIDAIKIAAEEKLPATNTVMMGALVKHLPFLNKDKFEDKIREQFKSKPDVIDSNIRAFRRGFDECVDSFFKPEKKYPYVPVKGPDPAYGKKNQPLGGYISQAGNSTLKDNTVTRVGRIPVFHSKNCIDCAQCEIVCPDFCIVFKRHSGNEIELGEKRKVKDGQMYMTGIDYQYCKGCRKCVVACPTRKKEDKSLHALTDEFEAGYTISEITSSVTHKN